MSIGPADRELLDLGMVAVPRLDLESVHQAPTEVVEHRGVAGLAELGVALEALEQHVEAVAEVAGPEVVEAGRSPSRRRAAPRAPGSGRSRPSPGCSDAVGMEVLRHAAEARHASRPRTGR